MDELLQKFSLRELRLVLLGLGAVVTAAAVMSLVVPKAKTLAAAKNEVAVLEGAAVDGAELDQHLTNQYARLDELKYQLHGDMADLPARQVESYIIGRLQRISWSNDIELVSVEPAIGERVQIFQEMLFNVQLSGQYSDLYRWVWDARNELGFVVVKEYRLTRQDNEDDSPSLMAELSLASYRAVE